jgi:uncharacterized membrane protein YdbT with pleckstrin-like domain
VSVEAAPGANVMNTDDPVLFDESPSMFRTRPGWFLFWCLLVPVLVGIVALLIWHFQLKRTRLQIIGPRVIYRTGFVSTRESEVRIRDVRDIEITRSLWQRMANTGTLSLSTSGESGMEIVVSGLRSPERIREIIHEARV